jgi:hypothetical protein
MSAKAPKRDITATPCDKVTYLCPQKWKLGGRLGTVRLFPTTTTTTPFEQLEQPPPARSHPHRCSPIFSIPLTSSGVRAKLSQSRSCCIWAGSEVPVSGSMPTCWQK